MRANPMTSLAALVLGSCLLSGISCKNTKTGSATGTSVVPPGDPLLPSSVSPPITPVKTTSNISTDATGHGKP